MAPAAALPVRPASRASAGTSTDSSPAFSTASAVVWKRTSSAVMQTVPLSMSRSDVDVRWMENRMVPTAFVAAVRETPRIWAW